MRKFQSSVEQCRAVEQWKSPAHLSSYFSRINFKCRHLKRKGLIYAVSSSNENIKFKKTKFGGYVEVKDESHLNELFHGVEYPERPKAK